MGDESEHHPLGPSTLKYVEICPGYRSSGESSVFTEEGTMLHEAVENETLEGLDDEQTHAVATCLNYTEKLRGVTTDYLKERKLTIYISDKDDSAPCESPYKFITGTADELILNRESEHIDLVDYKFGRGAVDDADINIQGQAYLLGALDTFPWAKTCTVHFILPRRDELLTHTFKRDQLEKIRMRVRLIIERATSEPPVLNPRTEACKFCRFRLSCPALRKELLPLAEAHSGNNFGLTLNAKMSPSQITDPTLLAKMLDIAPVLERWAQAAKKQAAKVAIEEGAEIPGHTLRYRAQSKKLEDAQEVFEVLSDLFTPDEFMDACSVTVAGLSKALSSKMKRGEKKNARPQIELKLLESGLIPEEEEKSAFLVKKS